MSGAAKCAFDNGLIVRELRALHEKLREDMRGYHITNPENYGLRPPPLVLAFCTESSVRFHKRVADVAPQLVGMAEAVQEFALWAKRGSEGPPDKNTIDRLVAAYENLLEAGRQT